MRRPRFFKRPADFRAWLVKNHQSLDELIVGFYKKSSGKASITWPESVDEALCAGWIDGIRRRIDEESYSIRFTPRRTGSVWSLVNTRRVAVLIAEGRMLDAGLKAFAARDEKRTGVYSFERETAMFPAAYLESFRANEKAWAFFNAQGDYYKRLATYWVTSAKQEGTRQRRMAQLIETSDLRHEMSETRTVKVVSASERDVPLILQMIRDLADYERMSDQVVATEAGLREALFGTQPQAEVILAYADDRPAGFALFFHNFSTFVGRRGLYLEDLFVKPEFRGLGIGRRLLTELARIAVERNCGRFEWSVLDWNEPAIGFYERLGAQMMKEWRIFRLTGDALKRLAS